MSTDALREAAREILTRWFPSQTYMTSDVEALADDLAAALAAPASETEKLTAKWRKWADALMNSESRDSHVTAAAHQVCADELEAALKADRQWHEETGKEALTRFYERRKLTDKKEHK